MKTKTKKPCKKCGTSSWYTNGSCKSCDKTRNIKWRRENKDAAKNGVKRWRVANRSRILETDKKWRDENKDKVREKNAKSYRNNIEERKSRKKLWRERNPDKVKAIKNNRRTRKTGAGGEFSGDEWIALCKQYKNKCLKCGRDDIKLTADHVIPVVMGGDSYITNIQPLCGSCNSSKGAQSTDYRNMNPLKRWMQSN